MEFTDDFVTRLTKRDKQAFEMFFSETSNMFYRYLQWRYYFSKTEIEDLLSDFYVKIRKVIEQYDPQYKFESFMWTVFKNLVKDSFKKSSASYVTNMEEVERSEPDDLLDMMQWDFQLSSIKQAMNHLDDLSYDIIIMRYVESKTYEEIAIVCDMAEDAIRKRLSRALRKIKDILGE